MICSHSPPCLNYLHKCQACLGTLSFFAFDLAGLPLAASLALARALGLPREGNLVRQRHGAAVIFRLAGQAVVIELEAVVSRFSQEHSLPSETHRRLADVCSHRRVPALRSQTAPTKLVPRRWSCGPPLCRLTKISHLWTPPPARPNRRLECA